MKVIKFILFLLTVVFVFYIAFRKSDTVDLRGNWIVTKIVLEGVDVNAKDNKILLFENQNKIEIRGWQDSLFISTMDNFQAKARIRLVKNELGENKIVLSSNTASLNGNFNIEIDTVDIGPESYRVYVKIFRANTQLEFEREVNLPPWKPRAPKRGVV